MLTTRLEGRAAPGAAPTLASLAQVAVDLDERAFLFRPAPAGGKPLTRLVLQPDGHVIHLDAVFAFNASRSPPRLFSLELADARLLAKTLVEAVYMARTQHAISETMRIGVEVLANGYRLHAGELDAGLDLYVGTASIWRLCQALLRAADAIAPVESH